MTDFDQTRAVELVETLSTSILFQKLSDWLDSNNKCIFLFEHSGMGIWTSDVLQTGEGFLLHTRAGPNSHYVRDIELNRLLGVKPLTLEGLAFRASKTGQWPNAYSFRNYLHELINHSKILQSVREIPT